MPGLSRTLGLMNAPSSLSPLKAALALALLLGLQPVTTDLYLPALPRLAIDLHAPMAAVQLTMSALLLSFGLAQLLMGPLADRFGRRPVLLGGLGLYALASVLAAMAPVIEALIAARALQGVGMAASVVCARAMVRDLYEPHEGAQVMSKAMSGLGLLAIASPTLGGLLTQLGGWRLAMWAVALVGLGVWGFIAWHLPETRRPIAHTGAAPSSLRRSAAQVIAHPTFRAWTALISATYGGLFVMLAGSSFVYLGPMKLTPWGYGVAMASASVAYLLGTFWCRRLLPLHGLTGAVRRGAAFTLAGGVGMVALGWLTPGQADVLPAVLVCQWLYSFGHGLHQPCGQAGAVGPFPHMAGVASALSGFTLALTAFGVGLWLGVAMDGRLKTLSSGLGVAALITTLLAWTLVQRHGTGAAASSRPSSS
jgi:MFS transporter, DHA1 family, multidrug resistance protein